ncbi:RPII140-upstream protein [Chionoecetes opilio]|uniref:Complex I assembly factor TIMMDC1, mitochondrial n=1 Tax=Chionoecetes opilio TaxID=41210 RepID=A0A8J4Y3B4_CHIOP|nr:RPII140-upstream protein [Chionoecetes opilio]
MAGLGGDKYLNLYRSFLASRGATRGGATLGLSLFFYENPDIVDPNSKTAASHLSQKTEMSGLQRLKFMFSYDAYGNISPELSMVLQSGLMGAMTGTVIGGTLHSRESYVDFMERNQGTAFPNMFEAQKDLQPRYSGGGVITGAIYKLNLGPRASVAGGVIGGVLGTMAGVINMAILYLTGTSQDELRKYHYEWSEQQRESHVEALRQARENSEALALPPNIPVASSLDPLPGVEDTAPPPDAKQ